MRSIRLLLGFCFASSLWMVGAHGQQPATLVIEGGTLIDGNGGTPTPDAVVVIQGNKIATVSRKGQVSYPATAKVVRADGKFILPGLWDSETNFCAYMGEAMLHYGITSAADIGNGAEVAMLYSKGVAGGKIRGPRLFTAIGNFAAGFSADTKTGLETPLSPDRVPKSVEEAREIAKRFIDAGAAFLMFMDGGLPAEYVKAAFEEAHKAGISAHIRPSGPRVRVKDAILAGADVINHSVGIAQEIVKEGASRGDELEIFAQMDDTKADELIQLMVQHNVSTTPLMIRKGLGYQQNGARVEEQTRQLFSEPNLLQYYPEDRLQNRLLNFTRSDEEIRGLAPDVYERRKAGYQKALQFYRRFVEAGGRVTTGGDAPNNCTPGLCTHHDLEIFAEAGFKPMSMIQSVTKWAAESFKVQDEVGTVEAGKLADLVIVNEDPLQDITNLQKIDNVILNGNVVDRGFHAWYDPTFVGSCGADGAPIIEGRSWVLALKRETMQGGARVDPERLPQPGIESISPYMVTEGDPTLTLTIKGFNFFNRSQVYFANKPISFERIGPTELRVTLNESLIRKAGRYPIVVKTPGPFTEPAWSDGTSNTANLLVDFRYDKQTAGR
jgi:imidazolonepropionase-like amidohydrolase